MQSLPKQANVLEPTGPQVDGALTETLSGSVCHQFFNVFLMVRRETEARMATHGLTDAQWKPLWMLKTGRARTAIELARCMGVDASAVTRLIDRLENKGLVLRVRSALDRRVVHLSLTDAGHEALRVVPDVLASVNADFTRGFTTEEAARMCALLGRMVANGARIGACLHADPSDSEDNKESGQ